MLEINKNNIQTQNIRQISQKRISYAINSSANSNLTMKGRLNADTIENLSKPQKIKEVSLKFAKMGAMALATSSFAISTDYILFKGKHVNTLLKSLKNKAQIIEKETQKELKEIIKTEKKAEKIHTKIMPEIQANVASETKVKTEITQKAEELDNKITTVKYFKHSNGKSTSEYMYDSSGKLLKIVDKNKTGKIITTAERIYDTNNRIIKTYTKNAKGDLIETYEYIYDSNGKLIKSINTFSDGKIVENTYNQNGKITGWKDKFKDGSTNEYILDKKGYMRSAFKKNCNGKIVKSLFDPHQALY